MKLPSRTDYPDYYEVIKRPLDLGKIGVRLKENLYESLDDLLSDLVLVFDNACKYNEPDSQLYKDALTLQHVALQTKLELIENENQGVPNIRVVIQDLLTNLFISVYNHQVRSFEVIMKKFDAHLIFLFEIFTGRRRKML